MTENQALTPEQQQFEDLIQGLLVDGYGCSDNFLTVGDISGLRNNIQSLKKSQEMKSAGLGNKSKLHKNQEIRGDKIKWLEKESTDVFEIIFLTKMDNFIKYLNETCYTAIHTFESHYASYEQKRFYKRHLDQFKNDNGRKYSLILYLNEDWGKEDGGNLSLYPKDSQQKEIAPIGGRMIFFKSDEMEHEVHPSFTRSRISIAGWFKG